MEIFLWVMIVEIFIAPKQILPKNSGAVEVPRPSPTVRVPSEDLDRKMVQESERSECFLGMCQLHNSDQAYVPQQQAVFFFQAERRGENKNMGCPVLVGLQVIFWQNSRRAIPKGIPGQIIAWATKTSLPDLFEWCFFFICGHFSPWIFEKHHEIHVEKYDFKIWLE